MKVGIDSGSSLLFRHPTGGFILRHQPVSDAEHGIFAINNSRIVIFNDDHMCIAAERAGMPHRSFDIVDHAWLHGKSLDIFRYFSASPGKEDRCAAHKDKDLVRLQVAFHAVQVFRVCFFEMFQNCHTPFFKGNQRLIPCAFIISDIDEFVQPIPPEDKK